MRQELEAVCEQLDRLERENARLSLEVRQLKAALASAAAIYRTLGDHPDVNNGAVAAAIGSVVAIYETFSSTASDDGHELAGSDGHGHHGSSS